MLGDQVREATIHDAAKSWQDNALIGPPAVEFAPYPKTPGGRRRNDNRQGTIDQDQEFKDFLEDMTNPITKPTAPEADSQKQEKVKTTPLIEALREKKATKEKPNSKANRHARGEGKDDANDKKILAKSGKDNAPGSGDKNRRMTKAEKAQAAKEAVKIINKEASAKEAAASSSTDKTSANPPTERKRGNVAGVKSLLQRDLGLAAAPTRRRGTKREVASAASEGNTSSKSSAAVDTKSKETQQPPSSPAVASPSEKAPQSQKKERPTRAERRAFKANLADKSNDKTPSSNDTKAQTSTKAANPPAPQILKKPQTPAAPKGPANSRTPTEPAAARNTASSSQPKAAAQTKQAPSAPANNAAPRNASSNPIPAPTSKQAFLKHANPSQGITEPLIEESLKVFGGIDKVEIDKRKGFAYVDFTEPEGLQKAMAASPIKIAQGAVQVLERKEKVARAAAANPRFNGPPPTGPARGGRGGFGPRGRGGRGGARGGGHGATAANAPATPGDSTSTAATVPPSTAKNGDAAT